MMCIHLPPLLSAWLQQTAALIWNSCHSFRTSAGPALTHLLQLSEFCIFHALNLPSASKSQAAFRNSRDEPSVWVRQTERGLEVMWTADSRVMSADVHQKCAFACVCVLSLHACEDQCTCLHAQTRYGFPVGPVTNTNTIHWKFWILNWGKNGDKTKTDERTQMKMIEMGKSMWFRKRCLGSNRPFHDASHVLEGLTAPMCKSQSYDIASHLHIKATAFINQLKKGIS